LARYHRLALVAQASLEGSQDKSCYMGALMLDDGDDDDDDDDDVDDDDDYYYYTTI